MSGCVFVCVGVSKTNLLGLLLSLPSFLPFCLLSLTLLSLLASIYLSPVPGIDSTASFKALFFDESRASFGQRDAVICVRFDSFTKHRYPLHSISYL